MFFKDKFLEAQFYIVKDKSKCNKWWKKQNEVCKQMDRLGHYGYALRSTVMWVRVTDEVKCRIDEALTKYVTSFF